MSQRVTRRGLLKLAGMGAASAFLAACAPKQAPQVVEKEVTRVVGGTPQVVKETVVIPASKQVKLVGACYSAPDDDIVYPTLTDAIHEVRPDIEIEWQLAGWDEYWLKLETGMAAGSMPDIFDLEWSRVPNMAFRGIPLALDPYVEKDGLDLSKYYQGVMNAFRWDAEGIVTGTGPLWSWAYGIQTNPIFYNKTMFDEAGIPYPTPDWTWTDFLSYAQQLTKDKNGDGKNEQWGTWVISSMEIDRPWPIWGAGGDLTTPDHRTATLDTPEAIEGISFVVDQIQKYKVAPVPGPEEVDPFQTGIVAMHTQGLWMITDYLNVKDFDWDITMVPKHPDTGVQAAPIDSDGWTIASISKDQDAAWEAVKALNGRAGQKAWSDLNYTGSLIEEAEEGWLNTPNPPAHRKDFARAFEIARPNPIWIGREEVWGRVVTPELEKAMAGEITVAEACKVMNPEVQKSLDEAWNLSGI